MSSYSSSSTPPSSSSSSSSSSNKHPLCKWGQDREHIYLTVDLSGHISSDVVPNVDLNSPSSPFPCVSSSFSLSGIEISVSSERVCVKTSMYSLDLPLYSSIRCESGSYHCNLEKGGRDLKLVFSKSVGSSDPIVWQSLVSKSYPVHYRRLLEIDWRYWLDIDGTSSEVSEMEMSCDKREDDGCVSGDCEIPEEDLVSERMAACTPTSKILGASENEDKNKSLPISDVRKSSICTSSRKTSSGLSAVSIPFSSLDEKNLDNAPPLDLDSSAWLDFFVQEMSVPQRMHTLVKMWNTSSKSARGKFLTHLVQIINSDESGQKTDKPHCKDTQQQHKQDLVHAAQHLKGGEEVLRSLDPKEYEDANVTYAQKWIKKFIQCEDDQRNWILGALFESLPQFDKQLVLSTFI